MSTDLGEFDNPAPSRLVVRQQQHPEGDMPVISRFLGITIVMYWNDHLPAHFHAKYGEYEVVVYIATGVVEGRFPRRALRLVLEWYELHKDDLLDNWEKCRRHVTPDSIDPLE